MDSERKININEEHPLNGPTGATKIYLNAGKSRKVDSPSDGTVIHLNTDKQADLGVHLNTTFSIASSKNIKFLFVLNFVLCVVCMMMCFGTACYFWHELSALRRQLDSMQDHLLSHHLSPERLQGALEPPPSWAHRDRDSREPRNFLPADTTDTQDTKKFFVEDLGDKNLLFVDTKKKKNESDVKPSTPILATIQKDLVIAQFNGASPEVNMGSQSVIGPWKRDEAMSSKNSDDVVELNKDLGKDHVVVKESGLYLIYAQIAYLTHAPNCYFVWAHQAGEKPRLLSMCGTGDDSSRRALNKAQISCSTSTVARLYAGDVVNLAQREANRTLLLKSGYSYFGFVKLAP